MWFLFQYILCYTTNTTINHADNTILKEMLKVYSMLIVKFVYKYGKYLIDVYIQCENFNKHVHCEVLYTFTKYIIPSFIKSVVFPHVFISWLIQTKEQIQFDVDKTCSRWYKYFPCCNTIICCNFRVLVFGVFFVTARQYRYALMCEPKSYGKVHETSSDSVITVCGLPLPDDSTIDSLKSLSFSLNFIDTSLKS